MDFEGLPSDIIRHELLPKMKTEALLSFRQTSKNHKLLADLELKKRIQERTLFTGKEGIHNLYNLARKYPHIKYLVIEQLTKNPNVINIAAGYITNLLDDQIQLNVDEKVYTLTKSGLYGLLLGFYLSNTLEQHNIRLYGIPINSRNVQFFFDKGTITTRRYSAVRGTERYVFSDLSFLSNLNVSNIKPNRVFDHRMGQIINPSYE